MVRGSFTAEVKGKEECHRQNAVCAAVLLLILLFSAATRSQDIRAEASVDSVHYLIGDWINLTVEVEHPGNGTIAWPQIADSVKPLEVIRQAEPTISRTGMRVFERVRWTLTAYDSGMFVIPSLQIPYTRAHDTSTHFVTTAPIPIVVRSVSVDTTQDIKDIKPPFSIPITFAEILPYLIGVAALAGIGWVVYSIIKKRRRGESFLPPSPPRPAHEVAREALRALEADRLWQRGKVKEYHTQLTDILRTYIEHRYGIMAMEMTTDEILKELTAREDSHRVEVGGRNWSSAFAMLKEILVRADLVKFAKFQPSPEENERSMALAFSFVECTQPASEAEKSDVRTQKSEKVPV